jgi:hypothetical protein
MSSQSDVESELAALRAGTSGGAQQALDSADSAPAQIEASQVEAAPVAEPRKEEGQA